MTPAQRQEPDPRHTYQAGAYGGEEAASDRVPSPPPDTPDVPPTEHESRAEEAAEQSGAMEGPAPTG
ncbi:MAG TPA: hypothetical protein VFA11_04350 [Acidimicrobiales bacterium]|nr:hypothetical protein [Acidimicrobiales bacterium]